jgi:hypothetical protein
MNEEVLVKEKGCVYFFRHIGLTPVKIGFSMSESPLDRFNQFKTYAPFGSEILGFIQTDEAKKIETELHSKFSTYRLKGEWFELTEMQVKEAIRFYQSAEDIKDRNDFEIAYAEHIKNKNEKSKNETLLFLNESQRNKAKFLEYIKDNKNANLNKMQLARVFNVTRPTIYNWLK